MGHALGRSLVGHYEVVSPLGVGGMGEVYRARDKKLDRDVALKVLPEAFTSDSDRLARFEREAKVLASLNHPHIGHIYGLEEADGQKALVLLVEGPTLADRIAKGPIPLDEALPIARQIAEALEAAHEQGIIHRDLKPANVKVKPDGTVKVLDFGLAKAFEREGDDPNASQSPTLTARASQLGVILGTAAYKAIEDAVAEEEPDARVSPQTRRLPLLAAAFAAGLAVGAALMWGVRGPNASPDASEVGLIQLTANPAENTVVSAALSPDGKLLAFADLSGLSVRVTATGETHEVPLPEDLVVDEVDWFPDGTTLLVGSSSSVLWKTSIFGGAPHKLAEEAFRAAVSPDGTRVAYLSAAESPSR